MSTPRSYLDAPLSEGAEIPGTPAQAHHLGTVLRRGPGDAVAVFNPRDGEFAATIAALRKDRCAFRLGERLRAPASEPDLRLVVAVLKRDALDWVVEKATELGVSAIHPVTTRRTVVDRVNVERLTTIARGAAEQSERLSIPVIHASVPLHAALDAWDGAPLLVAAERRGALPIGHATHGLRLPCGWLVGPEGGFEGGELDDATRRPFVTAVALGPRILRAETAAVAGLAVLQALAGDWAVT
ncbi:16S rRNA (uracil(1498)-N(3))-methyltransferase [Roseomonas sp. CAU 1739]|uniref:16S rRNA (uracil(1498)-N(3))-methyltransferase n=1 Tax=Roseomonas sp. CAU 1739 TaxID=3140364 RepID=UPI00325C18B5